MSRVRHERRASSGAWVRVVQGDLTEERVDAIVNAANEHLLHGGGVAGAIVRRGGASIQEESDAWVRDKGPVPAGAAAITKAGDLPAKWVVHAVGPRWGAGSEDETLANAVRRALALAADAGAKSVSLPAISSGIFGFPKDRCARVILDTVEAWLAEDARLQEIRLCNFDDRTAAIFEAEASRRES